MFFKVGYFKKSLLVINILNSFLILICFVLSRYYHPVFSAISFLTFLFPILFFVNFCFFVYWVIKIDLRAILPLFVFIGFFFSSYDFYKIGEKFNNNPDGFQVMSFNARLFNHYNWIKKDSIPENIERFLSLENPDILSIQEYHEDYQYLLKHYKNKYVYLSGNKVGQSIHTNNKIIKKGLLKFEESSNNAIFVDLIIGKDTLRVYNAHFESFRVDVQSLKADVITFKKVISKIKKAYLVQKKQSEVLINHILRSPYKTILTVDLNNTEHSYVYNEIKRELNDVFSLIGNGFGSTYDFEFLPIRIDYIFVSKSISANNFKIFDKKISDHMPISTFLKI